jgi:hypothetical protein
MSAIKQMFSQSQNRNNSFQFDKEVQFKPGQSVVAFLSLLHACHSQ